MQIVSNTSPLSNLAIIGEINLLQKIYPTILIPPIVHTELMCLPEIQSTISTLINTGLIPATKPLLDRLISEAGFRVSQALYDHAL